MKFSLLTLTGVVTLTALTTAIPAMAGDVQGDAYTCQELWVMRNQIFKDNGYCLKSSKAIRYFGNAGCLYDVESAVPLSKSERQSVKMMRASEQRQGC